MSKYLDDADDQLAAQARAAQIIIPCVAGAVSAVLGTLYVYDGRGRYSIFEAYFIFFSAPSLFMIVPYVIWYTLNAVVLWNIRAGHPREDGRDA